MNSAVVSATNSVEYADLAIMREAGDQRHHPLVQIGGTLSEIGDQPQMTALCGTVLAAGLIQRDGHLARTGLKMLAAHGLATAAKSWIKHSVKRTRPHVLMDGGRYEARPGKAEGGEEGSFPSGHTSSAVAVAGVVAFDYPVLAVPALGAAAAIGVIQIPRGKHYASDLAAGALIGLVASVAVELAFSMLLPHADE